MGSHDNISGSFEGDQNQPGSSGEGQGSSNAGAGQQNQPASPSSGGNAEQQNTAGSTSSGSGSGGQNSSAGTNANSSGNNTAAGSQGSVAAAPPSAIGEATAGVTGNVHDTKEALDKAKNTISDLLDGKANIVDAAMAAKGAFDAVKGLSGKISESLMMPVMKALGAFKGQAILPAAKQMDPVMGIDVHMVNIPPSPAPIPMPHPYIGMLFHAKDFVSCALNSIKKDLLDTLPAPAPDDKSIMASVASNKDAIAGMAMQAMGMSASVKFGDFIPRAVVGTSTKSIPHIPMGAGFFPAFDAAVQKNVGKAFLGSLFVVADGDPMVGSFHLNYDCWDIGVIDLFKQQRKGAIKEPPEPETKAELFVPSGTVMPIPLGRPVLVNSIPTPINPLSIVDKLFKAGLGKLAGMARKFAQKGLDKLNGKVGCGLLTAASKAVGTGQSHPVDVASGHFYTDNIDFKLPGPIPFEFERTWHSYSIYDGPLGYGWHHSYDLALAIDFAEEAAIMRLGDGRVAHFEIPTKEKEAYNRGEKLTLCLHEDGYYYATDKKCLIYRFSDKTHYNPFNKTESHLLQSIANRNGFAIRFSYDKNCTLTEIIDSAGRKLIVNNDGKGHITDIQAPDPRFQGRSTFAITKYTYTPEGDMSSQADALDQAMSYSYEQHQMVREVWRNGCVWQFRYDKTSGPDAKCVEVFGTGGLLHYKFDYTDPTCTIATNSRGFKKLFHHRNGVVTKFVDPLGAAWEYRYNSFNELEAETDPLGHQKATTYDQWGNVETVTEANGAFVQFNYGAGILKHSAIEMIDKGGGKWKWDYDKQGNLVKRMNPVLAITTYDFTDGLLTSISNALGNITRLTYEHSFNISSAQLLNGYKLEWSYDILGNCVRSSDSSGNTRKTQFDLLGLPQQIIEPDGNTRYLNFDTEANVIQARDNHSQIQFSYNPLNKIIFRTQAGKSVEYKYDSEGNLLQLTNELQEDYTFTIDAADRVSKEVGFDGISRIYERDAAGKISRIIRPGNKFTRYQYDEVGHIIEARYHDDTFERFFYSKNGLLQRAQNTNSSIEFERDLCGRVVTQTQAEAFINTQYDLLGNRTLISSSHGANISNQFDEVGNTLATKANDWSCTIKYDDLGLEMERLMPGSINCSWTRDKLGRPTRQQIHNNQATFHNRQYTWDVNYRLKRISDSVSGITNFEHDEIGNLTRTIFSDGSEQLRNPDAGGNLFTTLDHKDREYGKGGRLLKSKDKSYYYDDEGNLIEKREAGGRIWRYQWNAAGMLVDVTRPDGDIVRFTYDALGRRLSKRYKNTVTKWLWDGNKPLHEWKEHAITGVTLSDSSIQEDGIITWLFNEGNFAPIAKLKGKKQYSIATDHLGTPYQMFNESGEFVWEAQLDSYGKVRMLRGDESSCPFRYQGQYEDAETGLYYNRFRYYESNEGLYISQDPIRLSGGNPTLYSYVLDPNCNLDILGLDIGDNQEAGSLGESNSGVTKNTTRIPSASGDRQYRIPDGMDSEQRNLTEVKNVNKQSLTSQLKDDLDHANRTGGTGTVTLIVDHRTKLSKPLQDAVDNGTIILQRKDLNKSGCPK